MSDQDTTDEIQRTTTFPVRPADDNLDTPHIRNASGYCLPVAIIKDWTDSLAEDGGDAQNGRVPREIDAFVSLLTDADALSGEVPNWETYPDIWFGFAPADEIEVLITYFRP
jgi:hypothetical protein